VVGLVVLVTGIMLVTSHYRREHHRDRMRHRH
jgi:hypothetical protein